MKLETIARAGFWLCVCAIAYLSLVPGAMRPHTGASGSFEHFIAYAATGFLFAPGSTSRQRLAAGLGLAALSLAFELAQLVVPGRTGAIEGALFSTLGAWLGLLGGSVASSLWRRRRPKGG